MWEADGVVHCIGDKNQDSCALQLSDFSSALFSPASKKQQQQKNQKQH